MKSKKNAIFTSLLIFLFVGLFITYTTFSVLKLEGNTRILFLLLGDLTFLIAMVTTLITKIFILRNRNVIAKSFNTYVEEQISLFGMGVIVFNKNNTVIWVSDFIEERFSLKLIGKSLHDFSDEVTRNYLIGTTKFRFKKDSLDYEALIDTDTLTIVIKDVSNEETMINKYINERTVIGELEIDNFQQYVVILPEEDVFAIQSKMLDILDELVEKYNIVYRQYVNGKYIIITNQETLTYFEKTRFKFFDKFRKANIVEGISLSASMGIGAGTSSNATLLKLAKRGLLEAQSRGGDQISVSYDTNKPVYYGSISEITRTLSKVKIKQIARTLANKLNSPQIKNVVIFGHKEADLDAVGAALITSGITQTYKVNTYIQNLTFDSTAQAVVDTLSDEYKSLFISPGKARKFISRKDTLAIIVDTSNEYEIETLGVFKHPHKENIFIFDHHRIESLSQNISKSHTYIDSSASSTSEIMSEVAQFMPKRVNLSKEIAQMGLNGIFLDTQQFHKAVSSRTFMASAWLESFGASSLVASAVLKPKESATKIITEILSRVSEIKPGYYMAYYDKVVPTDVVSMAADEILRTAGRKAAFVIAKMSNEKGYKLSARGIETNVQVIAEAVGGGGHFASAAARTNEPLKVFVENIRQAIIDKKEG